MKPSTLFTLAVIFGSALAAHLRLFPSSWGLTPQQQIAFSILIIAATLWISEAIPLFVTSFIIVALQVVWLAPAMSEAGAPVPTQTFLSPFFSNIILLFLGGFTLSSALHKYHLDQRIALWIMARTGGAPSRLLLAVILISAILSMWMSNTATAAMMFAIILPIMSQLPADAPFTHALALSIPFACNIGGLGTPIGTPPNAIALSWLQGAGVDITFLGWMVVALPVVALALLFLWRFLLLIHPPGDITIGSDTSVTEKIKGRDYVVIAIFVATCIGWLTSDLHGQPTGVVSLLPIIALFGFRLLNTNDFRSLSWDVLFMIGGGLSLGLGLQESGLTSVVVDLAPKEAAFYIVILTFGFIGAVMSSFISNTATANLLVPLAISFSEHTTILVVTLAMVCSSAMVLPVSTPPNAIAFGSGVVRGSDMMKAGVVVSLVTFAIIYAASKFYWNALELI